MNERISVRDDDDDDLHRFLDRKKLISSRRHEKSISLMKYF